MDPEIDFIRALDRAIETLEAMPTSETEAPNSARSQPGLNAALLPRL